MTAAPMPDMLVASRIPALRQSLADAQLHGLVVTSMTNVQYLCGFSGSNGLLIVTADDAVLITDGRYTEQAPEELALASVDVAVDIAASLFDASSKYVSAAMAVGFEEAVLAFASHRDLAEALTCTLVPTSRLVEDLRAIKDEGEVARIEAAASIADRALATVVGLLAEEPTEQEFGFELDTAMRRLGAAERSFETIVGSGPNGAKPHARPTERRIAQGDLVVLDFGAMVDGYHSDMTRTLMVGEPTPEQAEMLAVVRSAQAAGRDLVAPGVDAKAIDHACRSVIDEAHLGAYFMHGTGHGVGLDIHEFPAVSARSDTVLQTGHVITVEPGVYVPGTGGVRVEDTVVVTSGGYRALTRYSKDPLV